MTASKKLALATYKYSDMDDQMKIYERRYVPKKLREQAVIVGIVVKLVMEKQVSFRWEY